MVLHQSNLHAINSKRLLSDTDDANVAGEILAARVSSTMTMIARKNANCYFQDNRRYVIQQWRAFVARQKNFTKKIKNALLKSAWHIGF